MTGRLPEYDKDDPLIQNRNYRAPEWAEDHADALGLDGDYHVIRVNGDVRYAPGSTTAELRRCINKRPRDIIADIPALPDSLRRVTEPWLIRWAQWVAAGRPDVKPISERDLGGSNRTNDWNPALHPRDPDTGKFVERTFSIPDDAPDFTENSTKENLQYLQDNDAEIDAVLDPNSAVTVDGVPRDATSIDDIADDEEDDDGQSMIDAALDNLQSIKSGNPDEVNDGDGSSSSDVPTVSPDDSDDESSDDQTPVVSPDDESDGSGDSQVPVEDISDETARSIAAFAVNTTKFNYSINPTIEGISISRVQNVLSDTDDRALADGLIDGLENDPQPEASTAPSNNNIAEVSFESSNNESSTTAFNLRRSFGAVVSNMDDPDEVTRVIERVEESSDGFNDATLLKKDAYLYAGSTEIREEIDDRYGDELRTYTGYKLLNPEEADKDWDTLFIRNWTGNKAAFSKLFSQQVLDTIQQEDGFVYTGQLPMGDIAMSDTFRERLRELRNDSQAEFRERYGESKTLYRGIDSPITTHAVVESWSTDQSSAKVFNGHAVLEQDLSPEDILVNPEKAKRQGLHPNESEAIVLGSRLEVPDGARANAVRPDSAKVMFFEPTDFGKLVGLMDVASPFMFENEPVTETDIGRQISEDDEPDRFNSLNSYSIPTYDTFVLPRHAHNAPIDAKHDSYQLGLDGEYHVVKVAGETRYVPGANAAAFRNYANARPRDVIRETAVLPDNLREITRPWLIRWAQWVAAGRPDVKPVSERDLTDTPQTNEWNPALHPRDPDTGKFVERSFGLPDDAPDFTDRSQKEVLTYLQNSGADINDVLNPNSAVTVDGVPKDATTIADIPDDPDRANPNETPDDIPTGDDLIDRADEVYESDAADFEKRDQLETLVAESAQIQARFDDFNPDQARAVAKAVGLVQRNDEKGMPETVNFISSAIAADTKSAGGGTPLAAFTKTGSVTGVELDGADSFSAERVGELQDQNYLANPDDVGMISAVVHEIGHARHKHETVTSGAGSFYYQPSATFNNIMDDVEEHISEYAATKETEFVAEGYAKRTISGDIGDVEPETRNQFEQYLGYSPSR